MGTCAVKDSAKRGGIDIHRYRDEVGLEVDMRNEEITMVDGGQHQQKDNMINMMKD